MGEGGGRKGVRGGGGTGGGEGRGGLKTRAVRKKEGEGEGEFLRVLFALHSRTSELGGGDREVREEGRYALFKLTLSSGNSLSFFHFLHTSSVAPPISGWLKSLRRNEGRRGAHS